MKNFWPHRSDAKGFSIENLARKYRERISNASSSKNLSQLSNDKYLNSFNEFSRHISVAPLSIRRGHWANRDFSEYKEAS